MGKPLTVAIVGAGHRSMLYASYALQHPERMQVVAVADPVAHRRETAAREHKLSAKMCFASYEDLCKGPPLADAVINGTMDQLHFASSMPLLKHGYNLLLEKPIARTAAEVRALIDTAAAHKRTVMICHVLRYAPFYAKIKEIINAGRIGTLVSSHTAENVSYHHMAVGFVRGRWNDRTRANPMLLAKCCHDLDIIAWLFSGVPVRRVASFGGLKQFRPENAPKGSAKRCLDGCKIESTCQYSARMNYVVQKLWSFYCWEPIEHIKDPTDEQKLESLRRDNPFGRCVWHCDNDVVDHQSVIVEFANGATASHDMFCATSRPSRTIHIIGSQGEIQGDMEGGWLIVRKPDLRAGGEYQEERLQVGVKGDGHGGGDIRLVQDFVSVMRGEGTSLSVTRIEDSLAGHLIAFAADESLQEGRVVELEAAGKQGKSKRSKAR